MYFPSMRPSATKHSWGGQPDCTGIVVETRRRGLGLSPKAALGLGLKVDADGFRSDLVAQIKAGKVDMDDPRPRSPCSKLDAVVGVTAFPARDGSAQLDRA